VLNPITLSTLRKWKGPQVGWPPQGSLYLFPFFTVTKTCYCCRPCSRVSERAEPKRFTRLAEAELPLM